MKLFLQVYMWQSFEDFLTNFTGFNVDLCGYSFNFCHCALHATGIQTLFNIIDMEQDT